jgi:hypothetical protein
VVDSPGGDIDSTSYHNTTQSRRNSSNNSRFTDLDMIDDEEMPMDRLQQVRKSRSTTPQAESIYPPRLVSPLNDSSDAVSSVSSAEEDLRAPGDEWRRRTVLWSRHPEILDKCL